MANVNRPHQERQKASMTPESRQRLRELEKAAPQVPWTRRYDEDDGWYLQQGSNRQGSGALSYTQDLLDFIIALRNAALDLLDDSERAERYEKALTKLAEEHERQASAWGSTHETEQSEYHAGWAKHCRQALTKGST